MARRSQIQRVLKWGGLAACLLTVLAWAASREYTIRYDGRDFEIWLDSGFIHYLASCTGEVSEGRAAPKPPPPGWQVGRKPPTGFWEKLAKRCLLPKEPFFGKPEYDKSPCWMHENKMWCNADLPLWLVLALLAPPTALLWYRDRCHRYPPGHCRQCGYNLTGNVSGVCPECGNPCRAEARAK